MSSSGISIYRTARPSFIFWSVIFQHLSLLPICLSPRLCNPPPLSAYSHHCHTTGRGCDRRGGLTMGPASHRGQVHNMHTTGERGSASLHPRSADNRARVSRRLLLWLQGGRRWGNILISWSGWLVVECRSLIRPFARPWCTSLLPVRDFVGSGSALLLTSCLAHGAITRRPAVAHKPQQDWGQSMPTTATKAGHYFSIQKLSFRGQFVMEV